jgi:hypothetical protein
MVAKCSYASAIWTLIANRHNFHLPSLHDVYRLHSWWEVLLKAGTAPKAKHIQVMIYTCLEFVERTLLGPGGFLTIGHVTNRPSCKS